MLMFCEIVSAQKNTQAKSGCPPSSWLPGAAQSGDPGGVRKGSEGVRDQRSFLPLEKWHSGVRVVLNSVKAIPEPQVRREEKEPVVLSPRSLSFFLPSFLLYNWLVILKSQRQQL